MKRCCSWLLLALVLAVPLPQARAGQGTGFCLECHQRPASRLLGNFTWQGPWEVERHSLCPAVRRARAEIFLTESRLVRLEAALYAARAGGNPHPELEARLRRLRARYWALQGRRINSLEELGRCLGPLRRDLERLVQHPLLVQRQSRKRRRFLLWLLAGLGLVSLAALIGYLRLRRRLGGAAGAVLLCLGLAISLLVGACEPQSPASGAKKPTQGLLPGPARPASDNTLTILALYELSQRAAPFPELARGYLRQALERLERPLTEQGGDPCPAWLYRVLAQAAQSLDPALARRSLDRGIVAARRCPPGEDRDRSLAGLALVLARHQPQQARTLAGAIKSPEQRCRFYALLARMTKDPDDLKKALQAARSLSSPERRALWLAFLARTWVGPRPGQAGSLLNEAWRQAGRLPAPAATGLRGALAARLARISPLAGLELAQALPAAGGVGFKALERAAMGLFARDPRRARQAALAAWRAAEQMPGDYERHKALGLLARDLAPSAPGLARRLLEEMPAHGMDFLRAGAQAAMVLSQAGDDWPKAVRAAEGIGEESIRLNTLARLAAGGLKRHPRQGRRLLRQVLERAVAGGIPLDPVLLRPGWRTLDPRVVVELAARLPGPLQRIKALNDLALALVAAGRTEAGRWCRYRALEAIKSLGRKQTLDKVRLLGDMGRQWYVINGTQARRFLAMGVEAALGHQWPAKTKQGP